MNAHSEPRSLDRNTIFESRNTRKVSKKTLDVDQVQIFSQIEQIRSKRLYIITPKEELKLVNFVIRGSWLDYILDRIILKSEESSQSVNCFLSILRIINLNRAQVLSSIFNDLILIWSNFIPILLRILRKYNEFLHFSKVEFWDLSNASNMYLFDLVIISIRFYIRI